MAMENKKYVIISTTGYNRLLNFLSDQPYKAVARAIAELTADASTSSKEAHVVPNAPVNVGPETTEEQRENGNSELKEAK